MTETNLEDRLSKLESKVTKLELDLDSAIKSRKEQLGQINSELGKLRDELQQSQLGLTESLSQILHRVDCLHDKLEGHDKDLLDVKYIKPLGLYRKVAWVIVGAIIMFLMGILASGLFPHLGGV